MKPLCWLVFLLLLGWLPALHGQAITPTEGPEVCRWVRLSAAPFRPDSLSIVPASLRIGGFSVQAARWQNSLRLAAGPSGGRAQFRWQNPADTLFLSPADSVLICYQPLPFPLDAPLSLRSLAGYEEGLYAMPAPEQAPIMPIIRPKEELFPTENIRKTGSITRGVTAGNAQDVFVNSALNLQLEGQLTEGITLTAAITDQNVPFQPEGNTQQIQEFDRIFLQLRHQHAELSAGDIILQNDSSAFLRYYKNVQGGQLRLFAGADSAGTASTTRIAISQAKGQFHSQPLTALEGVSGPYRLSGPNGERFIIVLANSEKVFLDGQPLQRGFNADYVIDYNQAEITFTNRVLITRFSRIRVDFEYATQSFARTILQASHQQQIGRVQAFAQLYQERDNRNNPLFFTLSEQDVDILARAGNRPERAISPTVDTVAAFDPSRILYTWRDTVAGGALYRVLVRASPESAPLLSTSFSEVPGGGNYVPDSPTANGRVFRWVAPVNGVPQGNWEPLRQLIPPNQRAMATVGASAPVGRHFEVFAEYALSVHDANLLSELGNDENQGQAFKVGFRQKDKPLSGRLEGYRLSTTTEAEWNQATFRPIDRFRYIEFDRDWSVETRLPARELMFHQTAGLQKDEHNALMYRFSYRNRAGQTTAEQADGWQQALLARKKWGRLFANAQAFWLHNNRDSTQAGWYRGHAELTWRTRHLSPGYLFSTDRHAVRTAQPYIALPDSVTETLMNFKAHRFYIGQGNSSKARFRVEYEWREDRLPQAGQLLPATLSNTLNLSWRKSGKAGQFNTLFTWRQLDIRPTKDQPIPQRTETLMGRAEWNTSFWKKFIRSEMVYNTTSGRELRRDFVFVQVEGGRGTHTWRDDNGDGVQDLNEFYPALNPDERNFAKFFVPTDEYLQAYTTQFNYRLSAEPRAGNTDGRWLQWVSRFSLNASLAAERRTTSEQLSARLLPFGNLEEAGGLLSGRQVWRSTLFFNRRNTRFGAEWRWLQNGNRQLLLNGFEKRDQAEQTLALRWTMSREWSGRTEATLETRRNRSDFLDRRNFTIREQKALQEFAWQKGNNWRVTAAYGYKQKRNLMALADEENEQARFHEILGGLRWSQATRLTINTNLRIAAIRFEGNPNSPSGYELLEALQPGTNLTWDLNWTQRLSNGLQLSFLYNGRKSAGLNLIHLGRMQVTALF